MQSACKMPDAKKNAEYGRIITMANIKKCDRCGSLMEQTYYEINITAHDANPCALSSSETLNHNLRENMNRAFNGEKTYCKGCKDEVVAFLTQKSK